MTGTVTSIWRHPIKSHGRERLEHVTLNAGQTMPWDRVWAVAHEASKADGAEWVPCANFSRVSKAPALMAISATLDEASETLTLSHPNRPDLQFSPDRDVAAFLDWVRPLMPEDRAASARIIRVPGRGMTDTPFPSVSINSHASLHALSEAAGEPVSPLRWRGNIWITGAEPWAERDWIGAEIKIGGTRLAIREHVVRCPATTANPATGERDLDTLGLLNKNWGHQDFGVYAEVLESGPIAIGDTVELL